MIATLTAANRRRFLLLLITAGAFGLRLWLLDSAPPGYNDDELSNAFAISQKILDGEWAVYYTDASGHEALFHVLVAGTIRLFGHNLVGLRLIAILLGTLAVPLTYQVGRRLFNVDAGTIAAAALAVSYWSLHYSRINQRHVSMPVFMLLAFAFFWLGLRQTQRAQRGAGIRTAWMPFLGAGIALGLGFYTYFAARGVPLILLAFAVYVAIWHRALWRRLWPGLLLTLGVAAALALPLVLSLRAQEGADARVDELAVPLTAARAGDFGPLMEHVTITMQMFHADGDAEFLYNIPHRPLFGPVGALILWAGVALATWYASTPWLERWGQAPSRHALGAVFLLGWWLAGLAPAFISVPPASLSHTIAAQPATYLLAALPVTALAHWGGGRRRLPLLFGLLLVALIAVRDLPDYYGHWPTLGNTRFLFHADSADIAAFLAENDAPAAIAVSSLLFGPWDRLALQMELAQRGLADDVHPRLFDPGRAIFLALDGAPALSFHGYPDVPQAYAGAYAAPLGRAGGYEVALTNLTVPEEGGTCFDNNLCLVDHAFDPATGRLALTWRVAAPLLLPHMPILSKPAPPNVYDGPRLAVFAQLLDANDQYVAGDDGFWVDPTLLRPGDLFQQLHWLPAGDGHVVVGLYDPLTGARKRTQDGADHLRLPDPE